MKEELCFADVNLPFHVWVREAGAKGFRWVLKDASPDLKKQGISRGGSGNSPMPSSPASD